LCMPIMVKNILKGVLYLENNLFDGLFNKHRMDLLLVLTSQMAITLENTRFFNAMVWDRKEIVNGVAKGIYSFADERANRKAEARAADVRRREAEVESWCRWKISFATREFRGYDLSWNSKSVRISPIFLLPLFPRFLLFFWIFIIMLKIF
jgi:hypothetical protein